MTRAEIEEIRGVSFSPGTLDTLMEAGWIRLRGRRRTPGRPITYGITDEFLNHFNLESIDDLPGLDELKRTGMLRPEPPSSLFPKPDEDAEAVDTEDDDNGEDDLPAPFGGPKALTQAPDDNFGDGAADGRQADPPEEAVPDEPHRMLAAPEEGSD